MHCHGLEHLKRTHLVNLLADQCSSLWGEGGGVTPVAWDTCKSTLLKKG